jgi:DNA primase
VPLRRRGRLLVGLCPFNPEKEPSFTVTPVLGRWHCFGACEEGGDVIASVMRRTGDSFVQAMERLGAGCLPPPVSVPRSWRELGLHEPRDLTPEDRRLVRAVAVLYHTAFWVSPEAKRYVMGRGISLLTAQQQTVGYARGDRLVPYLRYKGLSVDRALELGLLRGRSFRGRVGPSPAAEVRRRALRERPPCGRLEEFFQDRVVIADTDRRGDVIHLVGRALDPEAKPKYLSMPGIPKPAYGMARLDPARPVELVEGPFDLLTLLEWGYQGVAAMGTHLSQRDEARLAGVPQVTITPDADDAGWSAASDWALAIAPPSGRGVRLRLLPDGVKDVSHLAQMPDGRAVFRRLPTLTQMRRHASRLRDEEAHLARLLVTGKISAETHEILRLEWKDKLRNIEIALRDMERDLKRHIDDLEAGLSLLSQAHCLFGRLQVRERRALLRILVKRIIVDAQGEIRSHDLHSPFAYLSALAGETKRPNPTKSGSRRVTLGTPTVTRTNVNRSRAVPGRATLCACRAQQAGITDRPLLGGSAGTLVFLRIVLVR